MKLVVEGADTNSNITEIVYEITEVTSYDGYSGNTTDESVVGENRQEDYSFKEIENSRQFTVTRATTEDQGGKMEADKAWVDFWCKDYGGKAIVKITLKEGTAVVKTFELNIPFDKDQDKIADRWEKEKVQQWNQQYGANEFVGTGFFQPVEDKELRDPDGAGALVAQKTERDHISVLVEYRGFILDGGGHDGAGQNPHAGAHLRLSPVRKEGLLEVDREQNLANAPAGGVRDYLNSMSRVWSHAARGAGNFIYYILENEDLPAPGFLAGDNRDEAINKQHNYLQARRGVEAGQTMVNEAIGRFFTHVIVLSDVPEIHRHSNAFAYAETETNNIDQRGIYLLTTPTSQRATELGVTNAERGGTGLAHEYMHIVVAPALGNATWDAGEHLVGNPGGTALMGDVTNAANRSEATVTIGAETQQQIDFRNNPALR